MRKSMRYLRKLNPGPCWSLPGYELGISKYVEYLTHVSSEYTANKLIESYFI